MKNLKLSYLLMMIIIVASCTKDPDSLADRTIKIAAIPDIHYTHPLLLPDNIEDSPSLVQYLGLDRKLLEISDPIFRKVLSELISEKPDILLIPGDLTKDGELIGHEVVKDLLEDLENKGIKVFVVPGNNDILNSDAFSFSTEPPVPVDNITPEQFAEIYGNFGYYEALYRDENTLSYICEPYEGLWILGIDANEIVTENGQKKYIKIITANTIKSIVKADKISIFGNLISDSFNLKSNSFTNKDCPRDVSTQI